MELQLILQRLKATIDKMETLSESQFNYLNIVTKFDFQENCGTVCCVAGWYPVWFPKEGFQYEIIYSDSDIAGFDIVQVVDGIPYSGGGQIDLCEYHGLSLSIIQTLFYGETLLAENEVLVENDIENNLDTVIRVFKRVYELLEKGTIAPDYDDTDYYFD